MLADRADETDGRGGEAAEGVEDERLHLEIGKRGLAKSQIFVFLILGSVGHHLLDGTAHVGRSEAIDTAHVIDPVTATVQANETIRALLGVRDSGSGLIMMAVSR